MIYRDGRGCTPPNQVSVRRVEAALEQGPEAVRALLVSLRTPPTTEAVR